MTPYELSKQIEVQKKQQKKEAAPAKQELLLASLKAKAAKPISVPQFKQPAPKLPTFVTPGPGSIKLPMKEIVQTLQAMPEGTVPQIAVSYIVPKTLKLDKGDQPHIIVDALAGTGKTFTIIESAHRICGINRPGIVGTDEQEAIWSAIPEKYDPSRVALLAFNSSIATELKEKVPQGVTAQTSHAFCKRLLALNSIKGASSRYGVRKQKSLYILADVLNVEYEAMFNKFKRPYLYYIQKLVSFCKVNLFEMSGDWNEDVKALRDMEDIHGSVAPKMDSPADEEFIYGKALEVYARSHTRTDVIDFDDMIWMPWKLDIDIRPMDLLYVDERQDLNKAQQWVAIKAGRRLCVVGDVHQAIYGFAGADANACQNLNDALSSSQRGILSFPLTYTRRCPKRVVEYNQAIVPEFRYFPDAIDGSVNFTNEETFLPRVKPGDMVVCRTNAPLFSIALQLFTEGKAFKTTAKSFFKDVSNLVKSFQASNFTELEASLIAWKETQLARCIGSRSEKSVIIEDIYKAIRYAMNICSTPDQILHRIKVIMGEDEEDERKPKPSSEIIFLTSIHQAKGTEARNIWWLHYDLVPHPKARLIEQEINLKWVAGTRPLENLYLVKSTKKQREEDDE